MERLLQRFRAITRIFKDAVRAGSAAGVPRAAQTHGNPYPHGHSTQHPLLGWPAAVGVAGVGLTASGQSPVASAPASAPLLSQSGVCPPAPPLTNTQRPTQGRSGALVHPSGCLAVSATSYNANDPVEDRYDVRSHGRRLIAGVLDGHGGWQIAEMGRRTLGATLAAEMDASLWQGDTLGVPVPPTEEDAERVRCTASRQPSPEDVGAAIVRAFQRVDRQAHTALQPAAALGFGACARVGACACFAVLSPEFIVVGNAGDCRAVLGIVSAAPLPRTGAAVAEGAAAAEAQARTDTVQWSPPGVQVVSQPSRVLTVIQMSEDHNARSPKEIAKLKAAHPGEDDVVMCKSPTACYVKGRLQPTRSLGDFYLKFSEYNPQPHTHTHAGREWGRHIPPPFTPPYISATPEIKVHLWGDAAAGGSLRSPAAGMSFPATTAPVSSRPNSFLIIACDGLWDVLTNEEAVQVVADHLKDPRSAEQKGTPAEALLERVLEREALNNDMSVATLKSIPPGRQRRGLHDDVTVVVIQLAADGGAAHVDQAGGGAGKSKGWLW